MYFEVFNLNIAQLKILYYIFLLIVVKKIVTLILSRHNIIIEFSLVEQINLFLHWCLVSMCHYSSNLEKKNIHLKKFYCSCPPAVANGNNLKSCVNVPQRTEIIIKKNRITVHQWRTSGWRTAGIIDILCHRLLIPFVILQTISSFHKGLATR